MHNLRLVLNPDYNVYSWSRNDYLLLKPNKQQIVFTHLTLQSKWQLTYTLSTQIPTSFTSDVRMDVT